MPHDRVKFFWNKDLAQSTFNSSSDLVAQAPLPLGFKGIWLGFWLSCMEVGLLHLSCAKRSSPLCTQKILRMLHLLCSYVHRVGRTGRGGTSGTAITLFTPNDESLHKDLAASLLQGLPEGTSGQHSNHYHGPPFSLFGNLLL